MHPCGCDLSEDLLPEILKRLPVKSLLRFTSVSKPWRRLIKDPDFVTSHLQFKKSSSSSPSSVLGFVRGRGYFRYKDPEEQLEYFQIDDTKKTTSEHLKIRFPWRPKPDPKKNRPSILTLGHCNGLVLAYDGETHLVYEHTKTVPKHVRVDRYIIFNPIARRFKILPEPGIELPRLAFEDDYKDRSPESVCGLGFIDNLVYKVVRITYGIRNEIDQVKSYEPARAQAYDSRSGHWREVPVNADLSYEDLVQGVYNSFDGCLYWFGRGYREWKPYSTLVSFHLVDEVWHETLLPYKLRGWTHDDEDGVFGVHGICERVEILGESVVMLVSDRRDDLVWNVWKMNKEDGHKFSWAHMYGFHFEGKPQGFFRDGTLLLRKRWLLVLHDLRTGFMDLDRDARVCFSDFVESLVPLDGESLLVEDDPEEEELEEPKSSWEEDEDFRDLTSLFDENLGDRTSLFDEGHGDLTSLFDEYL